MANLTDIPFSILDLAPVVEGSDSAQAFKNMVALAQLAEALGYNRYWLAEHHNMPGVASSATAVLIAHVANHTKTIRVGSGGIMLPNHSPLVIAEQFGTLESIFNGRIDLGLGRAPGTDPMTARALRRDSGVSARDFPELVAELALYLSNSDSAVKAHPGVGTNVPLWLLASSTYSASLAAELGLPFAFASHFAPDELYQAIKIYRRNFKPSHTLAKPYVMVGVPLIAADSDREAQRQATSTYQKFLALVRGKPVQLKPPVDNMTEVWSEFEAQSVRSRLAIAIIGGAETCKRKLTELLESTQADEFIFVSDFYDFRDRLRSFEILASIKEPESKKAVLKNAELADRR